MQASIGLVFQYFFTIGVAVGFGLVVGLGVPIALYLKLRGKSWAFLQKNSRTNR